MFFKVSVKKYVNAAAEGDVDTVKKYIQQGGDVNSCTKSGESAVGFAIMMKHTEVVNLLLDAGLDVNSFINEHDGNTPLHEAAFAGSVELVGKMIECGADVNKPNKAEDRDVSGRTPLINACYGFHDGDSLGTIKLLIDNGADVNAVDALGKTALMHAVDLVRSREAAAMFGGSSGGGGLADAFSMIGKIIDKSNEIAAGATDRGDDESLEIIKLLIGAGADVNARDNVGNTAILVATHHGLNKVIDLLKELGAEEPKPGEEIKFDDEDEEDYDDEFGDDPTQWRGLASQEVNECTLLVKAGIDQVSDAFSQMKSAASTEKDVKGKEVVLGEECYVVYQLSGHPWTLIEILHGYDEQYQRQELEPEDALKMSQLLNTKAIDFKISDTAYAVGYELFENGESVEKFEFHGDYSDYEESEEELDDDDEDEDDGMIKKFESRIRECSKDEYEDGMDFSHKFLKAQDAFVPGWSEGGRTSGSQKGKKMLIDLQLCEDGSGIERMDFVLVK